MIVVRTLRANSIDAQLRGALGIVRACGAGTVDAEIRLALHVVAADRAGAVQTCCADGTLGIRLASGNAGACAAIPDGTIRIAGTDRRETLPVPADARWALVVGDARCRRLIAVIGESTALRPFGCDAG